MKIPSSGAALVAIIALFAFPNGSASAQVDAHGGGQAPKHFQGRLRKISRKGVIKALAGEQGDLVHSSATAELAAMVQRSRSASITPFDRALSEVPILLGGSGIQSALKHVETGARPTRTQLRLLRKTLEKLSRNAAIRALIREGVALKRHPPRLRRAAADLRKRIAASAAPEPADEGANDPLFLTDRALRAGSNELGGRSPAQWLAGLLASPGATGYLASLPPLSLAALAPRDPALRRRAPARAKSSIDPDQLALRCSTEQVQALTDAVNEVAAEMPSMVIDELGHKLPGAQQVALLFAAERANGWFSRALAQLGWDSAGEYENLRRAAIDCYAARIALDPGEQPSKAGEWKSFALSIYGQDGTPILKHWIGRPDSLSIAPADDSVEAGFSAGCNASPIIECFGQRATPHTVRATLGDLPATAKLNVEPGPTVKLKVLPDSETVGVGDETEPYRASGEDQYGNLTASGVYAGATFPDHVGTHLRISPADGSCSDLKATCTPGAPGPHNVIIEREDGVQDHVRLEVLPSKLVLSPQTAKIATGDSQAYSAEEVSGTGKTDLGLVSIGPAPSQAKLSITNGTCDQSAQTCMAAAGHQTVTVTPGGSSSAEPGHAALTVGPGTLEITPSTAHPAIAGAFYQQIIIAEGAKDENITWELVSGTLPPGITFGSEGKFAGFCCSVESVGSSTVTVRATDSEGDIGERTYHLESGPPACTGNPCAEATSIGGEITVAWNPACVCGNSGSPDAYYLAPYVNGVWGGSFSPFFIFTVNPYPLGEFYEEAGRAWMTWDNFFGPPEFPYRTVEGDSVYVKVGYAARGASFEEVANTWTVIGDTNSVTVR